MPWLTNVRLPLEPGSGHDQQRRWRVGVDDTGVICVLEPIDAGIQAAGDDWDGDWLSPMGLDLQINGGLGLAFPELTPADLPQLDELLELLWRDGVEAICPTLVTCGVAPLRQALEVLAEARRQHRPGRCRLLGAHLEGPFLAYERRGAHPAQHLAAPSPEALEQRIGGFSGGSGMQAAPDNAPDIAIVTLAPELEGSGELIRMLRERDIVVSLGHSAATEEESRQAFAAGVSMLTHAFNAMPDLHRRAPGPVGAAALHGGVTIGLIADGVHVLPTMAVLLQRLAPRQVVLVSDALAPYGLPDGRYRWDERELLVEQGTCRLADGGLAGVTLPLLESVRRLAGWSGDIPSAVAAATVLPRAAFGDRRSLPDLLLGLPLNQTLRWSQDPQDLRWQHSRVAAASAPAR